MKHGNRSFIPCYPLLVTIGVSGAIEMSCVILILILIPVNTRIIYYVAIAVIKYHSVTRARLRKAQHSMNSLAIKINFFMQSNNFTGRSVHNAVRFSTGDSATPRMKKNRKTSATS